MKRHLGFCTKKNWAWCGFNSSLTSLSGLKVNSEVLRAFIYLDCRSHIGLIFHLLLLRTRKMYLCF